MRQSKYDKMEKSSILLNNISNILWRFMEGNNVEISHTLFSLWKSTIPESTQHSMKSMEHRNMEKNTGKQQQKNRRKTYAQTTLLLFLWKFFFFLVCLLREKPANKMRIDGESAAAYRHWTRCISFGHASVQHVKYTHFPSNYMKLSVFDHVFSKQEHAQTDENVFSI